MIREFGLDEFFYLLLAARWTIALTTSALLGGGLLGLIFMVLRIIPARPLNWLAIAYIQAIQGTPVLAQLFVFYFGLAIIGYDVSPWMAATVAFSIYAGAYFAEIWRGCVEAVPRAQWEAAESIGLSFLEQLRYVVVPQALRISIPPSVGFTVQLIKNTSLASIIGFIELTRAGQIMNGATYQPLLVYVCVAAIYFMICFPLSRYSQQLESRLHVAR